MAVNTYEVAEQLVTVTTLFDSQMQENEKSLIINIFFLRVQDFRMLQRTESLLLPLGVEP
jgi:hypothetical protein